MTHPNCDLLSKNMDNIMMIREFLETLRDKGVSLKEKIENQFFSISDNDLQDAFYEFFGIDYQELENERRAILEEARKSK